MSFFLLKSPCKVDVFQQNQSPKYLLKFSTGFAFRATYMTHIGKTNRKTMKATLVFDPK